MVNNNQYTIRIFHCTKISILLLWLVRSVQKPGSCTASVMSPTLSAISVGCKLRRLQRELQRQYWYLWCPCNKGKVKNERWSEFHFIFDSSSSFIQYSFWNNNTILTFPPGSFGMQAHMNRTFLLIPKHNRYSNFCKTISFHYTYIWQVSALENKIIQFVCLQGQLPFSILQLHCKRFILKTH